MSVDYCIYPTDSEPITVDELRTAVLRQEWQLIAVRDYYDLDKFRVVRGGTLHDGDCLFGWQHSDPFGEEYESALAKKDFDTLNRWSVEERSRLLGACDFYIDQFDCESNLDPDDLSEIARTAPEYADALRRAKLEYIMDLHSDADFLKVVARCLCQLRGGAWTDNCEIYEVSEKGGPMQRCDL